MQSQNDIQKQFNPSEVSFLTPPPQPSQKLKHDQELCVFHSMYSG